MVIAEKPAKTQRRYQMKILLIVSIVLLVHFIGGWVSSMIETWLICTREIYLPSMRVVIWRTFLWELGALIAIVNEIGARFFGWKIESWEKENIHCSNLTRKPLSPKESINQNRGVDSGNPLLLFI